MGNILSLYNWCNYVQIFSPLVSDANSIANIILNIMRKNSYLCFQIKEVKIIAFPNRSVFSEIPLKLNFLVTLHS